MQVLASAHPNIALVKYWGKQDAVRNLPAVSSVSITLDRLTVRTRVGFAEHGDKDRLSINGHVDPKSEQRAAQCFDAYRVSADAPFRALVAESDINFPVAAGLASSAAGFAALVTAADVLHGGRLSRLELARLAGQASGSAARSMYGGFVYLAAPENKNHPINVNTVLSADAWPLSVVIAVTTHEQKAVGSTEGMEQSRLTSPFYDTWVANQAHDVDDALAAIQSHDFERLATISEHNCLKMHAVMLSSQPGLVYWNGATVEAIHRVRGLRRLGHAVFFTIDAGPQIKAVCDPDDTNAVADALADVPGVVEVMCCGLGPGATATQC
ncbi:MAG: diphosphomevalonate decarboxylase [Pseudomonadota bacterium]